MSCSFKIWITLQRNIAPITVILNSVCGSQLSRIVLSQYFNYLGSGSRRDVVSMCSSLTFPSGIPAESDVAGVVCELRVPLHAVDVGALVALDSAAQAQFLPLLLAPLASPAQTRCHQRFLQLPGSLYRPLVRVLQQTVPLLLRISTVADRHHRVSAVQPQLLPVGCLVRRHIEHTTQPS